MKLKSTNFGTKIHHFETKIHHFEVKIHHFEAKIQNFEAKKPAPEPDGSRFGVILYWLRQKDVDGCTASGCASAVGLLGLTLAGTLDSYWRLG